VKDNVSGGDRFMLDDAAAAFFPITLAASACSVDGRKVDATAYSVRDVRATAANRGELEE
jgi:hypothetical protein